MIIKVDLSFFPGHLIPIVTNSYGIAKYSGPKQSNYEENNSK